MFRPRTLTSVLQHNVINAKRFIDIISKVKGFKHVSKIDADSGFWTLHLTHHHSYSLHLILHGTDFVS